jgi:L-lactate utilization protein LutC
MNTSKIKAARSTPTADPARGRLRQAIAEREAKEEELRRVEMAEARGRELLRTLQNALAKFGDLDAVILNHRAKRVTDAAQAGSTPPDLKLPADLAEARKARDEATEQVAAAQCALKNLGTKMIEARNVLQRAERLVGEAAQVVLVEEATFQAVALIAAWSNVWHLYDTLVALPGPSQQLPADAVRILRLIPGIDHRQFPGPGGRNPALARAKGGWKTWFDALLQDADAPMPELVDDGASSAPVVRVA